VRVGHAAAGIAAGLHAGKGIARRIDARRAAHGGEIVVEHVAGPALLAGQHASAEGGIGVAAHGGAYVVVGEGAAPRPHDQTFLQTVHIAPQEGIVLALAAHQPGEAQPAEQHRAVLAVEFATQEAVVQRGHEAVTGTQPDQCQTDAVAGLLEGCLERLGQGLGD